ENGRQSAHAKLEGQIDASKLEGLL
ncbi:MAG: hypothetical protein ACJAR9_001419, partial [Celeribacter sp.]